MKIIHCADIHIGSILENLPTEKAKIRKREVIDTFKRMADYAKENGVEAVIIAGDFFDRKNIAKSIFREVFEIISSAQGVDFLYLAGNHDERLKTDTDIALPQNFLTFDDIDGWKTYRYGNITISGIDITKQFGDGFYEKLRLSDGDFNIAVLHGDLNEVKFDRLKNKKINYLALGHIHIPDIMVKKLDLRGVYGYSGCLEGRGFDEIGQRGFMLLTVEKNKLEREFVSFSKRQYKVYEIDITDSDSHFAIWDNIINKVANEDAENIVRVVLTGKYKADTQKEVDNLETKLNEKFFFAQVKDNSRLDYDSVDYKDEISLRHEFVSLVNDSALKIEQKDKIIEFGIKALLGEEIDI